MPADFENVGSLTPEDRLHLELGRLTRAFGQLDFNIGLQLQWLGTSQGLVLEKLLTPQTPFALRLDSLESLVLGVVRPRSSEATVQFSAWFRRAQSIRILRNGFVHGRWGIKNRLSPMGPIFQFTPLNWENDPQAVPAEHTFSLTELENEVNAVKILQTDYFQLHDRYKDLF